MPTLSNETWFLLAGIAAFGVLGFLFQVAVLIRNDRYEHELKIRVVKLRAEQAIKVRDLIAAAQAGMKKAESIANRHR